MVAEPEMAGMNRPEASLQQAFVAQLRGGLRDRGVPYVLIESFGLDVAIFATPNGQDRTVFFELKAFVGQRAGGVGFGNQKGFGPQVELLFDQIAGTHREPDVLRRLDRNVRWLLADGTRPSGSERYAIFTSEQAQAAAMGGVRTGKQNNLRIKSFDHWHSWDEACKICLDFVIGG